MADIQKIKTRLAALLRKARDGGSTEAEVAQAMAAAQKMMEKYGVSESDLESVTADDYKFYDYTKPAGRKNFDPVVRLCGGMIAKHTGVLGIVRNVEGEEVISFYGIESDVEYATWLIASLQTFLNDQWNVYKRFHLTGPMSRAQRTTEQVGFIRGFCSRIVERLHQMQTGPEGSTETGTALVVKKSELAVRQYESATGARVGGRRSMGGNGRASVSGQAAGYTAGGNADLGRGVGQGAIAIGRN